MEDTIVASFSVAEASVLSYEVHTLSDIQRRGSPRKLGRGTGDAGPIRTAFFCKDETNHRLLKQYSKTNQMHVSVLLGIL